MGKMVIFHDSAHLSRCLTKQHVISGSAIQSLYIIPLYDSDLNDSDPAKRNHTQTNMSANVVYRLSSSPLFRWMSRRHSSSKLFIGGLSYDTNEPVLKDVFGQHGEIIEVKVICDHKSGKSKGYGFVNFVSEDSASKALAEMDGQVVDGRNIRIHYANKK